MHNIIVWFNVTNLTVKAEKFCMEKATFYTEYTEQTP